MTAKETVFKLKCVVKLLNITVELLSFSDWSFFPTLTWGFLCLYCVFTSVAMGRGTRQ